MLREVTEDEFRQSVNEGLVLADFFSSTCGPCKMLSFVLADVEKVCGEKVNIMKVDFDKNKKLVEEYEVSGYPTLILMRDGTELKRMSGLQQKPAIIRMIEEA
ncbi:MAG: thioredoxin fold domain-containing protein [Lachnospiraceae bacterium]|jgi:thioredoxin 1|nr:thioredoxin fold domain-containing protein [Lachnospiraceae bacterium]